MSKQLGRLLAHMYMWVKLRRLRFAYKRTKLVGLEFRWMLECHQWGLLKQ